MNYIIDGHNLIAHIPGMSLSMLDDEQRLVQLLNHYAKFQKGKIEVFFDGAPIGQAGKRNYGRLQAYFVIQSQTADEAIRGRLARLGKSARNWKVVSSDRGIQAAAREIHAEVIKSELFARQIMQALEANTVDSGNELNQMLSPAEVEEWLAIFKQRKSTK